MADLQKLATDLQVLKNEVEQVASVNTKLDSAIDKLTDISGSIKSMLAVHEEKLSKQEEIDKAIFNLIENRRVEFDTNYKELHARINKIHKELTDEIEMSEKRLMCEIKTLNSNLDGRIGVFEKYRWIIIGAAIVLGLSMPQILSIIKVIN
jgi:DNA repair exonuclease SbcCD ATPase subunit|tara:strand:- start:735 stop:1187 length:453 start_codon:yes stop_codon:yes gene_type:complete